MKPQGDQKVTLIWDKILTKKTRPVTKSRSTENENHRKQTGLP